MMADSKNKEWRGELGGVLCAVVVEEVEKERGGGGGGGDQTIDQTNRRTPSDAPKLTDARRQQQVERIRRLW